MWLKIVIRYIGKSICARDKNFVAMKGSGATSVVRQCARVLLRAVEAGGGESAGCWAPWSRIPSVDGISGWCRGIHAPHEPSLVMRGFVHSRAQGLRAWTGCRNVGISFDNIYPQGSSTSVETKKKMVLQSPSLVRKYA